MLVSIIVPVYNVEQYLGKCIRSILSQTYKNLEIILVDDGSTDGSGAICDTFAEEYVQVKVIHQNNRGQGSARNKALEIAQGDYYAFVDSDDWIDKDFLERMVEYAAPDTVVCCGYNCIFHNKSISCNLDKIVECNTIEFIDLLLDLGLKCSNTGESNPIGHYLWNKLWPKKVFVNNKFDNIKYEDVYIFCDLIFMLSKAIVLPASYYNYLQRDDSTVHTANKINQLELIKACLKQERDLENYPKLLLKSKMITAINATGYMKVENINTDELKYIQDVIKKRFSINFIFYKRNLLKLILCLYMPRLLAFLQRNKNYS